MSCFSSSPPRSTTSRDSPESTGLTNIRVKSGEPSPKNVSCLRQLRDIRQKIYLTELSSSDVEGVQGQLHHAKCIYNALSDIKPEVENVIKLGRKIVDSEESPSTEADSSELTGKIDALKADFNDVGKQITEAKKVLEKALGLAESLHEHLTTVQVYLNLTP